MGLFDKLRDIKFEVEMKASDIRYAVSDKFDDVKYFVEDKVDDVKFFVGDKVDDMKYFVEDKFDDVKDFAGDKLKIKSKGDVAEVASYVLFPQQIPLKLIMSNIGKNTSANIQSKNSKIAERAEVLEGMQKHGEELDANIQMNFANIKLAHTELHSQLRLFAQCFEQIHNRPTYNIKSQGSEIKFDDLFNTTVPVADFARLDEYLINIYDEDASIIQGLFRTPVFAAILKFREKALLNKMDDILIEINECIENMRPLVQYLNRLNLTSGRLSKELNEVHSLFSEQVQKLEEIVNNKTDFEQFTEKEITILDTNIKLVQIIVTLMNTHIFNQNEFTEKGLAQINTSKIVEITKESEQIRKHGDVSHVSLNQ